MKTLGIIGRGLAGLSLALRGLQAGFKVTLLGPKQLPETASRAAQGIVCNKGLLIGEQDLFQGKLVGQNQLIKFINEIENLSGVNLPKSWGQGVVEPYFNLEEYRQLTDRVYHQRFTGCYRIRHHTFTNSNDLNEVFQKSPLGYLHYLGDGWIDVEKLLDTLEGFLRTSGVQFIEDSVLKVEPNSQENGAKIFLSQSHYSFDVTVLANGFGMLQTLKESSLKPLNFIPVSGRILRAKMREPFPDLVFKKGAASLATYQGTFNCGSTSHKSIENQPNESQKDFELLMKMTQSNFGLALSSEDFDRRDLVWGIRVRTQDRSPVVGFLPFKGKKCGIFLMGAFYKNGLQLSDICAQIIISMIRGIDSPFSYLARTFNVSRFLDL